MAILNAEIPDDLKRKLDVAVAQKDITVKQAVAEAVTKWLGIGEGGETEPDPDVEALRRFKEIGSPEDIKFLRGNISVFLRDAERTRRRKGA